MICVAGWAVLALRRTGYRLPMTIGFSLIAAGLVAIALTPSSVPPYAWLAVVAGITGVRMGLALPASNNAILSLAPDQDASIAGMRGMFRQCGSIISISIATAVVARSSDPGRALGHIFLIFAVALICVLPLVRKVPEHRGEW